MKYQMTFLKLISKICEIQREDLQGCMITSANFFYEDEKECEAYQVNIVHENAKGMTILVQGMEKSGKAVQSLKVKLIKAIGNPPKGEEEKEGKETKHQEGKEMVFSCLQVEKYLQRVGDTNAIHRGKKAVVPGLYIVCKCMQGQWEKYESVQAKFYHPVWTDEKVRIHQMGEKIIVLQNHRAVEIKLNKK